MFKFDFKVQEEPNNPFIEINRIGTTEESWENAKVKWYDSREILPNMELLDNFDLYRLNSTNITVGRSSLTHIISGLLLQDLTTYDNETKDIKKAEDLHSDLLPGIYEGGAKIWECTSDLLSVLSENDPIKMWQGKRVLDLGCGGGLLGIYAYNCGAKEIHFQDYNEDVLEHVTIPNVLLNTSLPPNEVDFDLVKFREKVKFYSGDWRKYAELTKTGQAEDTFDVILTSETIYNPENQEKLLDTLDAKLKSDGIVFVAAKTHYFGVGGGLRQFETLIGKDERFQAGVLWTAAEGVGREILKLKRAGQLSE